MSKRWHRASSATTPQLFGTPFTLSGQGDTNVILGPPPEGATTLAVVFNCHHPASYHVRLDGKQAMTVTCNEESTPRASGASFFPTQIEDVDSRLAHVQAAVATELTERGADYILELEELEIVEVDQSAVNRSRRKR